MSEEGPNGLSDKGIAAIHRETAAGWEVVANSKYREELGHVLGALKRGESQLSETEQSFVRPLCRGCHRVIHLQCSNGAEVLSLLGFGAEEAVGVDISEEMIAQAQEMTEAIGATATWYCCDVLETPYELDATADLVYTGGGALPWIMDIDAWAGVVFRLLRPGGTLYLSEGHPLSYSWDIECDDYRLVPGPNYCAGGIVLNRGYPSTRVAAHTRTEDRPDMRERIWPLGDVMNALIRAGLVLKHFQEEDDPGWPLFPNMPPERLHRLPHMYSLLAGKPDDAR